MSLADATLRLVLLGEDRTASTALAKVGSTATATETKLAQLSSRMTRVGKSLTLGLTLPAVAVGAAAIKMSTDFNSAMTRIQTQAGGSAKDVKVLSQQVLDLGGKVQQGPVELANSLYHLKSVGMDNANAMKALVQSSHLAAVGNSNLEDTTNALAGAWRTGIAGAHNFNHAVATLNAIVGAGNMSMQDLTGAMSTGFLPAAKTFGLSLHDVGAALAVFTDEGQPAQVAATRMRMMFSLLGAPTSKAAGLLKTIGINASSLAVAMRKGGLVDAIGMLKDHLQSLSKVQQSQLLAGAFGGGRSSAAIMTLINNFSVLQQKEAQVSAGMSRFGADVAKQAQTPQAQFKILVSTLETVGVQLGNVLLPYAIKAAVGVKDLVDRFTALSSGAKNAIGILAGIAVAMGPIMLIGGAMLRMVQAVLWIVRVTRIWTVTQWALNAAMDANPVGILVLALEALAVVIAIAYMRSKTFRTIVNTAFTDTMHVIVAVVSTIVSFVKAHWALLLPILGGPIGLATVLIVKNFGRIEAAVQVLGSVAKWLWNNAFQPSLKAIVSGLGVLLNMWGHMLTALGHVPGFGWATAAGKALENAAGAAQSLADNINKIPSHKTSTVDMVINTIHNTVHTTGGRALPGMASGGTVTSGGLSWVGERGPELMYMPRGASVVPLSRGAAGGLTVNVYASNLVDPQTTAKSIQTELLKLKRQRGGSLLGLA